MKKYYESEAVTLWHADAMDVLPELGTESVDLVLTDPPYGMEFKSGRRAQAFAEIAGDGRDSESRAGIVAVLEECVRVGGQNRHLYVFGPEVCSAAGLKVSAPAQMVWDKATMSMGNLSVPWGPSHELLHFYTNLHRHAGKKGSENNPVRLRKGSVLRFGRKNGTLVRHPTEKPLGLLQELIESSSRVGELVLDPYAGVGSTGVAAVLAGRKAVLVEIDEGYCEIAAGRLKAAEDLAKRAKDL